jgi:hypothetical protein
MPKPTSLGIASNSRCFVPPDGQWDFCVCKGYQMTKFGNDELGWDNDPRDAASAAMWLMAKDCRLLEVIIMRWDRREDGFPEQKVPAFRLERV